jgi:DNA-binding MarR family transcriptional regulator
VSRAKTEDPAREERGSKSPPALAAASKEGPLGETLDFMRLLWAVDHGLQSRSKRMEAEIGVTGMQRLVIRLIGRQPGVSAGELADLLHVHPSTLTGVLKRLVDRGYVERDKDPEDARRARFSLRPPGEKVDATQAGTVEAAVRRALGRLPGNRLGAARDVLAAVAAELARSDR